MPLLERETDIFPANLFDLENLGTDPDQCWWAIYTLARREKDLMRRLAAKEVPFYGPVLTRRNKSPGGRMRTSFVPLFPSYVFVYGTNEQRYEAMTTNCVARYVEVVDGAGLTRDLRQFFQLIEAGAPLLPEDQLQPGMRVRVKSGRLSGIEGVVIRREGTSRLLVSVEFLQKGASLLLHDLEFEQI